MTEATPAWAYDVLRKHLTETDKRLLWALDVLLWNHPQFPRDENYKLKETYLPEGVKA